MNTVKTLFALAALGAIAGCATQSADSGFGEVKDVVRTYAGTDATWHIGPMNKCS